MDSNSTKYDWIVAGGGIAGISLAEILSREGKSVLLLEKNSQLASETTKVFHEWYHSGSLYTLAPDNLSTLRYLLGATDDLLEYYSCFPRMNLNATESGLSIDSPGWFNNRHVEYKYRVHKLNPVWMAMVSKSIELTRMVSSHDWIRRRAGGEYGGSALSLSHWLKNVPAQVQSKQNFISLNSPDVTMNSRDLIFDMLNSALGNGLNVELDRELLSIKDSSQGVEIITNEGSYRAEKVVLCSPDLAAQFGGSKIKTGYAPMAIVDGLAEDQPSFVELDYNIRKCINLLNKGKGVGQAGGITLNKQSEIDSYLDYIVAEHKKRSPGLRVIDTYVGIKKELVSKGEERNYLYHINSHSEKVWSVVLGKFSLAFSMAPEFFRQIYHRNPPKTVNGYCEDGAENLISPTSWQEIVNENGDF